MIFLNHIAIAVVDLPLVKKFFDVVGFACTHTERVDDQGVNTHFIPLATSSIPTPAAAIELLESVDPQGTVAKYLSKRGPGIHHLSFQVGEDELEALTRKITSAGFKMIYAEPKIGAHSMRVNFVHPATTGGILIEIMEALPPSAQAENRS
jgi:methylmalonyl-CoA/ethylmalonyl-CoA epimerase